MGWSWHGWCLPSCSSWTCDWEFGYFPISNCNAQQRVSINLCILALRSTEVRQLSQDIGALVKALVTVFCLANLIWFPRAGDSNFKLKKKKKPGEQQYFLELISFANSCKGLLSKSLRTTPFWEHAASASSWTLLTFPFVKLPWRISPGGIVEKNTWLFPGCLKTKTKCALSCN